MVTESAGRPTLSEASESDFRSAWKRPFGQWIGKMPSAISPVCWIDFGVMAAM